MKTNETQVYEIRLAALERSIGRTTEAERTLYLELRDGGDSHSEAVETVRGERIAHLLTK